MALTTATITGDIADQLGNDFDNRRTKIWLTTNVPGQTIIDTSGDKIRLGSGNVTLAADGTFTAVVWVPGVGSNPASWQTTIHVDYPDRNATNGRAVKSFGPFTITANANLADLVAEMPVQPEYLATVLETVQDMIDAATDGTGPALTALADRLDGVDDHGNVAGALTLDPAKGFHIFDATAPVEVELGTPPGYSLAFKAITGATNVTIDGLPDLELTDDAWATFVHYRSAWHLAASGASGGGDVEPVTDPPTQPGAVTVDPTADSLAVTVIPSTIAAGYEWWLDSGPWVDHGPNPSYTHTGLTPGSEHTGKVRAYNTLGQKSAERTWGPTTTDSVGLHEQLLAYTPGTYLRWTDGTQDSFGTETGTWGPLAGSLTIDGPGLMEGDTSSAYFAGGVSIKRTPVGTDYNGLTACTIIAITRLKDAGENGGLLLHSPGALGAFGFSAGPFGNEMMSSTETSRLIVFTKDSGGTARGYRDGVLVQTYSEPLGPTLDPFLSIHGNVNGSDPRNLYMARFVIIPNVALTEPQIVALAQAAGVYGQPR